MAQLVEQLFKTRGPRFESSHRQIFILNICLLFTVNCNEKTKITKKEAGNGPFFYWTLLFSAILWYYSLCIILTTFKALNEDLQFKISIWTYRCRSSIDRTLLKSNGSHKFQVLTWLWMQQGEQSSKGRPLTELQLWCQNIKKCFRANTMKLIPKIDIHSWRVFNLFDLYNKNAVLKQLNVIN